MRRDTSESRSHPGQDADPGRRRGWRSVLEREDLHRYLHAEGWREFSIQEPVPRSMAGESADHCPPPLTTGPSAER